MNRLRVFVLGTIVAVTLAASAQQPAAPNSTEGLHADAANQGGAPNVDEHLRMLSERLQLTADQQTKIRPVLQRFLDERQQILADKSLSSDAKHQKVMALHEKADHDARKFLNDDQKKQLDQLEQESHH